MRLLLLFSLFIDLISAGSSVTFAITSCLLEFLFILAISIEHLLIVLRLNGDPVFFQKQNLHTENISTITSD